MQTRATIDSLMAGGEGGIARGCAAHPSLTLGTAVAKTLRRPAPPLARRLVEPEGSNPSPTPQYNNFSLDDSSPLYRDRFGGEGGIRTLEHLLGCYSLSRRAPSTTRPPLHAAARVPEVGQAIKSTATAVSKAARPEP